MESQQLPMKVVGRKGRPQVNVVAIDSLQRLANEPRNGRPFMPKGVWRFKTHEEPDAWRMKMLTRRSSRVSPRWTISCCCVAP
jgi:hypothetical protein